MRLEWISDLFLDACVNSAQKAKRWRDKTQVKKKEKSKNAMTRFENMTM